MDEIIASDFADDKKLAEIITSIEDCKQLQEGINDFMEWCNENDLKINKGKCKVMTFTRKKNPIIFSYTIDGELIRRVDENTDLGVSTVGIDNTSQTSCQRNHSIHSLYHHR